MYRGLTGVFLLLRNFSVAISVGPHVCFILVLILISMGGGGGAMVLGKLPMPGRPTIWITVGQRPTALAVGAGGGCLDIFTLIYPFFPLSPSLWETARYRLKYCLKGPLNPKQPTNHWVLVQSDTVNDLILFEGNLGLYFMVLSSDFALYPAPYLIERHHI